MLEVSQATMTFITQWVVPLAQWVALKDVSSPSGAQPASTESRRPACIERTTPNIHQKIMWMRNKLAWKVKVKMLKRDHSFKEVFHVDRTDNEGEFQLSKEKNVSGR